MTTLMDIVEGCENYLGWQPRHRPGDPGWRARSIEVRKLRTAMKTSGPAGKATINNLLLALEYSRRRRLPVNSPIALLHRIDAALALAYIPPVSTGIAEQVADAIQWERDRDDADSLRWIHRLARAAGPGQADVLIDWAAGGRG